MKRFWVVVFLLGCDKLLHREAPAASVEFPPPPVVTATSSETDAASPSLAAHADAGDDDDDDNPLAGLHSSEHAPTVDAASPACPYPIHPSYCRRSCRSWLSRSASMHARRVSGSTRSGKGTCGAFNVFAEDGSNAELVEYYDATTNELVGAIDKKQSGCNRFGTIPACTPTIAWTTHAPIGSGPSTITPPPDPFQGRK